MKTMNMPGFMADKLLTNLRVSYHPEATFESNQTIIPQMAILSWNSKDKCIRGCLCNNPINCPCCGSDSLRNFPVVFFTNFHF
jgi:hypothetical protein